MTTREDIIIFIIDQLKMLKEEKVAELLKNSRIHELEELEKKLDFSMLREINLSNGLELTTEEYEDFEYELSFYINRSKIQDAKFFKNQRDFIEFMEKKPDQLAHIIAETMRSFDLMCLTISELINGVPMD